jgi:hypothetical protein
MGIRIVEEKVLPASLEAVLFSGSSPGPETGDHHEQHYQ